MRRREIGDVTGNSAVRELPLTPQRFKRLLRERNGAG
jgi:hypothetical protein